MNYSKDDIITLEDNKEFIVIETVDINNILYLYLRSTEIDTYTIVKVIGDRIYNLEEAELSLVIATMIKNGWEC